MSLLDLLFPLLNEENHVLREQITARLKEVVQGTSDEQAKEAFQICFRFLFNTSVKVKETEYSKILPIHNPLNVR